MSNDLPENYSDVVPEGRPIIGYQASPRDACVDSYEPFEKLLERAVKWALDEGKPVVRMVDIEFYLAGNNPDVFNRVAAEGVRVARQKTVGWPRVLFKTNCQKAGHHSSSPQDRRPSVWMVTLWIE